MRRRNLRTKETETLKKTDSKLGFTFPEPSSSRLDSSDLKRGRRVTFVDVDNRSPLNDSPELQARKSIDAKTSEFAFFKKLKSDLGLCSESSGSKSSNKINQNSKTFESRLKTGGINREAKDGCKSYSFSTPIHNAKRRSYDSFSSPVNLTQKVREKDLERSSQHPAGTRTEVFELSGISEENGDMFSVKRTKLHRWVRDTWFPENPELTLNGHDLVSVLLTRLFPGTEETHNSRISKEGTDRDKRSLFHDSPRPKSHKRSHETYTKLGYSPKMNKSMPLSCQDWLEESIAPSLQFPTAYIHSSFIPRNPEEISFSISYPKSSVCRPPLLTHLPCLFEDTMSCSPSSSLHLRNNKPLSPGYHGYEGGYHPEDISREPALLLECDTVTANTEKSDNSPINHHWELITLPNASSSSLIDYPWSFGFPSHDLVTRELPHPLPNVPPGHFLLPTTNSTSHFDQDEVVADLNLKEFHYRNNSDCLSIDNTCYHNHSNSPLDHGLGYETVSFPFSTINNSNLLESSSPIRSNSFKANDWISF